MEWITWRTGVVRQLEWAQREITALREERMLLLRDLADARDRGDQAVNQLLTVKGAYPVTVTPSPPPHEEAVEDVFSEDREAVTRMRELITVQGVEAAFHAR